MKHLETFHLQNNQLVGEIPKDIGANWKNIISFDLSFNNFNGTIPNSVETMACNVLSKSGTQCNLQNNSFDINSCNVNKCVVKYCNACD